jgi:hypothetical protein
MTELDFDSVEAIGLDGTGRDQDSRFPYTLENLRDGELLWLNLLAAQDEHYPEESAAGVSRWLEPTDKELVRRFGDRVERLSEYSMEHRASLADLIKEAEKDRGETLVQVIAPARWHDGDVVQTQIPYDDNPTTVVRIGGRWVAVLPDKPLDLSLGETFTDTLIDEWVTDEESALVKIRQEHLLLDWKARTTICVWCREVIAGEGAR